MNNLKEQAHKEFDVQFPISIDYPPITSSEVLTRMEIDARHKRAIYKHEQIKNFISSLLTQQKKEIVEMIELVKKETELTLKQTAVQRDKKTITIYECHINAYKKILDLLTKE